MHWCKKKSSALAKEQKEVETDLPSEFMLETSVKASDFAPLGNFRPVLARSVSPLAELRTKHKQNEVCESKVFLQLLFRSFFSKKRFDASKPLE
jgi:hypothetical protein